MENRKTQEKEINFQFSHHSKSEQPQHHAAATTTYSGFNH